LLICYSYPTFVHYLAGSITLGEGGEDASSYEQASSEFYMKQLITCDPIHEAVAKLESKHQKVIISAVLLIVDSD